MSFIKRAIRKIINITAKTCKRIYFTFFKPKVVCNICGCKDYKFNSDDWHPNTICPNCRSQVRQRLFVAILQHVEEFSLNKLIKDKKLLHFAPDNSLSKILKSNAETYQTADLFAEGYHYPDIDYNIDMSDMKIIKDETYDCVLAFDVLEHIPNHLEAIKETHRILKTDGCCVFTVPQKDNLEKTIEDLTITDPKEREIKFGQWDHWRIYGNDFENMMTDNGFRVFVMDESEIDKHLVDKHVLFPPVLSKHPLATNYRKIYFGIKE